MQCVLHIKLVGRVKRNCSAVAWRHPETSGKFWSEVLPSLSEVAQLLYSMKLRITSQLEVKHVSAAQAGPREGHSRPTMKYKYQLY